MIMIGGAQSLLWIITIALGDVKTGVYAACATLVCIGNPFLVAMHNVLVPRTSAVFAESGRAGLRRVVARTTIALIMTMTWFSVVLAIFGEWLVRTLYGAEFGGHQSVVTLLALSELAFAAILAVGAGLTVLERSDLLFRSHVTGLFVTIGLALALTGPLGLTGAALARFAGTATTATIIALCYRRISRDRTGSSDLPAFHVENITAIAQGTSPDQGVRLGRGL
jgi:O-antigen/teichoic acid export membrane protein